MVCLTTAQQISSGTTNNGMMDGSLNPWIKNLFRFIPRILEQPELVACEELAQWHKTLREISQALYKYTALSFIILYVGGVPMAIYD